MGLATVDVSQEIFFELLFFHAFVIIVIDGSRIVSPSGFHHFAGRASDRKKES